ncbi:MAG: helix-turn-helix domain-containing protein [Alphaproteobacteria bacterium]|nr:helix-turn-helix domain-containing protein [Alphaproteobacteria bacterium]
MVVPASAALSSAPTFLDTAEAAELLRVSPRTLERWRLTGGGPNFRRHGKQCLYALADLVAWSDKRTFASTSTAAA